MTTPTATAASSSSAADVLQERLIDAEYKIWKKNTPFLYDFVMTHALEWPSLTCQWLPKTSIVGAPASTTTTTTTTTSTSANDSNNKVEEHSLLLGTHTTGTEPNYLMVASVFLPKEDTVLDNRTMGDSAAAAKMPPATHYNQEKQELGGYGFTGSSSSSTTTTTVNGNSNTNSSNLVVAAASKLEIKMKICHDGEVHRARYMPQNPFIVASRSPNHAIYLWDLSKHPSVPPGANHHHPPTTTTTTTTTLPNVVVPFSRPQALCVGHEAEGYGLVWSTHTAGHLLSGSSDATLCLWDVSTCISSSSSSSSKNSSDTAITAAATAAAAAAVPEIQPLQVFKGHTDAVEDVDWHLRDANMIGSVGDDATLRIWDVRCKASAQQQVHCVEDAHGKNVDVNCLTFHPTNEFLLATAGGPNVSVWDLRSLKCSSSSTTSSMKGASSSSSSSPSPLHALNDTHQDDVYQLEWHPHCDSVLAAGSADRRVAVWDLTRIGMEQTEEDAEDGPPELLFLHGGHTAKVSDLSWNRNDPWTMASVSEDNVLQIWHMAEEIYAEDDDDDDEHDDDDDEKEHGTQQAANGNGASVASAATAKKGEALLGDDELE